MKFSIAEHQDHIKNWKRTLDEEEAQLKRKQEAFEQHRLDYLIYKSKIERAIQEGKDGFDSERYGQPRNGKKSG
jgi:hypothetical protein